MADSGADLSRGAQRSERLTTETKQAFKTTEFWTMVAVVVGILIASAIIGETDGGGNGSGDENQADAFPAIRAWLYVTIAAAAYMVSRGLAKAGSRDPYWADRDDRPNSARVGGDRN